MPSPTYRQRSSTASLARMDSKGAAIRRGDLKISDPIQPPRGVSPGINEQFTAGTLSNPTEALTPQSGGIYLRKSVPPGSHTRTRSNGGPEPQGQPSAPNHATSRISVVPSMLNGSLADAQSKGSLKKQKDGGLRAKIGRMFGSRRLRETTLSTCAEVHSPPDPPTYTSVESTNNGRPVQTSSQHLSHLTRLSALGSHSPKPPEQVEHMRQDLGPSHKTDDPVSRHRRRNTLPSVALSTHESQMLAATLGEVGMRPTSKTALHSDGGPTRNIKRRSRSADELRDEARSHQMSPIQWRRRSGEIQYWRNSVLEKPLPAKGGIQREAYNSRESEQPRFGSIGPSSSSFNPSVSRDSLKQFQFDSFTSANGQIATMEQRVTTLEVKFVDHEYAIAQLQGCNIARPVASANTPKRRSVQDLFPEPNERQFSPPFDQHGQTFLSSPRDSPTPADDIEYLARQARSSNVPTLRPINTSGVSSTSPSGDSLSSNEMTAAQFDKLMSTLKAEQAARRTLEEKVTELQAQIEGLRNAPHLLRRPGAYPTPSPESRHSTLAFRGQSTRRSVVCFPTSRVRSDETSRFSITDADDTDTDDGFLDTYETPREAQDSRFGFHSNRSSTVLAMI